MQIGVWSELDLLGVFGGEEEGGGVMSGPGEARTILLFHIISASPSKEIKDIIIIPVVCNAIGLKAVQQCVIEWLRAADIA